MERAIRVYERLKGPVVPVNLCFKNDDSLDYVATKKYVGWLCEQKVPVILLTMGSSEMYNLTDDEIWKLTEELAEEIAGGTSRRSRGRSLFIASTGFWCIAQCRKFLKHADSVGVDAVKVQISTFLPATREVIVGYFDRIIDAAEIPLLLWSVMPSIPVEVVAELAKRPQIVGMKNDSNPFYDYYDYIRATADDNFGVISGGQMRNFFFGYQVGSPAYLCPIAPFRPDIALQFYNLLTEGRINEARDIVFQYEEPWLTTASKMNWLAAIKSALYIYRLYPNNRLRAPMNSHTQEELNKVRTTLEEVFGPIKPVCL